MRRFSYQVLLYRYFFIYYRLLCDFYIYMHVKKKKTTLIVIIK